MIDADSSRMLQFALVLERLERRTTTKAGARAACALQPTSDIDAARVALAETSEALELERAGSLPVVVLKEDGLEVLAQPATSGVPLLAKELAVLLRFVRGATRLRRSLLELREAPHLHAIGASVPDLVDLLEEYERSVDDSGQLADTATPRLSDLRRRIGAIKDVVRQRLDRFAQRPDVRVLLRSAHPAIRDGRFVLAVRTEARGQIKGLYHDRSSTGATAYVEPEVVVEEQNELRDLVIDEQREVIAILWRLTQIALDAESRLRRAAAAVVRFDLARARALLALDLGWTEPEIGAEALEVAEVRHPVLSALAFERAEGDAIAKRAAARAAVTPFDLRLGTSFDLLVLTGPNTGGKTITLKAVGLVALLPRIGCFVPAARGARVPFYSGLFVDIGDEQDLTQSLSTFSAHVKRIARVLAQAQANALVLLDELGSGTDPLEGEALAIALLDRLLERSLFAIVTTHLGRLKEFAGTRSRAMNGSMQFDPATLRPTYRLLLGVSGASNALRIAHGLGLDPAVLDRAEIELSAQGRGARAQFDQLDQARAAVERARSEAERDRREAAELRDEAAKKVGEVTRERSALMQQAEAAAESRLRAIADELDEPRRQLLALGGRAAHVAGVLLESLRRALSSAPLAEQRKAFLKSLKPGDSVHLPRFNETCRVRRVLKDVDKIEVDYRTMSVTVGFDEIAPVDANVLSRPRRKP